MNLKDRTQKECEQFEASDELEWNAVLKTNAGPDGTGR